MCQSIDLLVGPLARPRGFTRGVARNLALITTSRVDVLSHRRAMSANRLVRFGSIEPRHGLI